MYELLYDYVKPNYGARAKLSYIDIDSFIVDTKGDNICEDTAKDVETSLIFQIISWKFYFVWEKIIKSSWINER